jgi:hypothetical protein
MRSFTSDPFSFSIGAPLTWKLVPATFPTEEYKIHNENLIDVVADRKRLPIVRIAKPVPDNRTISPAVQVFVELAEGQTPVRFLTHASKSAALGFADFQIAHEPEEITLHGLKAAYIETTFTVEYSRERRFPTLSRLWAIPRGKLMFVIAASGQPDDLKALDNDIKLILTTVRFTNE